MFETTVLPAEPTAVAPDGSDVRVLVGLGGGGMAHFELGPGQVAVAVRHRTVDELWYVTHGRGQMWRAGGGRDEVVDLHPGTAVSIPAGTSFQFRSFGHEGVTAVAVTMPPWPGEGEAELVDGPWQPTVEPGPH